MAVSANTPKEDTYAPLLADVPLALSQLSMQSACGLGPFVARLRLTVERAEALQR